MRVDTSTRLKEIMNERGLKQIDIVRMSEPFQRELNISMGKSTFSQYVNGVQSPDQDRIFLLSKTLNVNEPWLMGFDVPKERISDDNRKTKTISDIYKELERPRQVKVYDFASKQLAEQNSSGMSIIDNKVEIDTLAAHSDDRNRKFSKEELQAIKDFADEEIAKFKKKNNLE